jgi:hypothetical protein
MSVYVAKDELIRVIADGQEEHYTKEQFAELLATFPIADVRENKKAEIKTLFAGNFMRYGECGNCGQTFTEHMERPFNFCPYCGGRRK